MLLRAASRSWSSPARDCSGRPGTSPSRLWEVQNGPERRRRSLYFTDGHRHAVHVRGVTGENVRRFLVSRDGSRLVAVLRGRRPTGSWSAGSGTTPTAGPSAPLAPSRSGGSPPARQPDPRHRLDLADHDRRARPGCRRPRPRCACSTWTGRLAPDEVSPIADPGTRPRPWSTSPARPAGRTPFAVLTAVQCPRPGRHRQADDEPAAADPAGCTTSPTPADPQRRPRPLAACRPRVVGSARARRLPRPGARRHLRRLRAPRPPAVRRAAREALEPHPRPGLADAASRPG